MYQRRDISKLILNMKKEGSILDISRRFLRICNSLVSKNISFLLNLCMEQGVFPDAYKLAKITPVFKKGASDLISNYRPISILSNFSKIFESVIFTRIQNFFIAENLLSNRQFGFRKDRSTELAIFDLLFKILPAFEMKKFAICVFLDYSACFDTICRDILICKLRKYGVRGMSLQLVKSYFSNRQQYVTYQEAKSVIMHQNIGVVQGSRLGPLLFDIYSNDFNTLCTNDENILYADDTCLVYVGDNLIELLVHVNERLAIINDWCNANKLFLNRKKSEFMLVTNKYLFTDPELFIGNDKLSYVNSFKYLGVKINNSLKFHSHIDFIKSKLSRMCGVTYRLKNFVSKRAAKNLYFSCVYSIVSYCIATWGGILLCTHRCLAETAK